jgi:leucyl aminopeptidase
VTRVTTAPTSPPPAPLRTADGPLDRAWTQAELVALSVGRLTGTDEPVPGEFAAVVAAELGLDLPAVVTAEKVTGRAGDVTRRPVPPAQDRPARILLVGIGAGRPEDLRRAGAAVARAARGRESALTDLGTGADADGVRAAVEGLLLGGWTFTVAGTKDRTDAAPAHALILDPALPAEAVRLGRVHAEATLLARRLAATPSDVKDPAWLAGQAEEAARSAGLEVEVWDEHRLAAEGFGGVLAVAAGSAAPPRFVRVEHRPAGTEDDPPVVLVGKGITFDTGGLAVKPREGMVPMKTDMSGAAAVLAAVVAAPAAGVRRRVVGLLPLAENSLGAASYRPGDVVRHHGGRTTEVVNTDAEGRLVLADAIAWANAHLDPAVVVDVATLTGAASLGLGRRHAALYSTDDALAAQLVEAAAASGERAWRMPLVEDYRAAVDSDVADVRQAVTEPGYGAGSITAALFLREFADGRPWAHLDIAGPARSDKEEHEVPKGATGYGARLLLRWLESTQ